ncbi:hypothetical protein [Rhodococcus sp. Q1]|uniref:hypothetical protein n=1 Tax=Rhodococcus TaxID=1827 RepID=UPI001F5D8EFD|nr:hypothetical protein [Rhodococcus sp. Q1]
MFAAGDTSQTFPRYVTITRSLMLFTTAMLWAMKIIDRSNSLMWKLLEPSQPR